MSHQVFFDIVELLFQKGVNRVVMSPGSRCAPLTLAFARHPEIRSYTISDERSAAFIALGMAQKTREPVALLCTSGTAGLNYYPAIAEAFYRRLPLIAITADRPKELIDQWDGQTIRQKGIYDNHILGDLSLNPQISELEESESRIREINNLINIATVQGGPVHINVHLREPLYPLDNTQRYDKRRLRLIDALLPKFQLPAAEIKKEMNTFKKMMIVIGQMDFNRHLNDMLSNIARDKEAVVVCDHTANLYPKADFIILQDIFLKNPGTKKIHAPDLLITLGMSVLSKRLKEYLRKQKNMQHWQIGLHDPRDTYQKLSRQIKVPEEKFIQYTQSFLDSDEEYVDSWMIANQGAEKQIDKILVKEDFNELNAMAVLLRNLPKKTDIHSSNSLPTRYLNLLQKFLLKEHRSFCNRGTSGIDGCSSTAVGHALSDPKLNILFTGDLAFFYDRNAFWHNYELSNLRIILFNNHGGGIFRVIKGPSQTEELDEYFDTRQVLNARNTANDFNMEYLLITDLESLRKEVKGFFTKSDRPKIMEIETEKAKNEKIYKDIMNSYS